MSRLCTQVNPSCCGGFFRRGAWPGVGCGRTVRAIFVCLHDLSIRAASMSRLCTHVNRSCVCFRGVCPGVDCGRTVRAFLVLLHNGGTSTAPEPSFGAISNFIRAVRACLVYFCDLGAIATFISGPCTHVNRGCGDFRGAWPGVDCGWTVRSFSIDLCNFCARAATVSATPTINNYLCGCRSRGIPCRAGLSRRFCEWTICARLVSLCNGCSRTAFEFVGIARYSWR